MLSGQYEDDEDLDDLVLYTGQDGRDPETRRQIADQSFVGLNRSLAMNVESGNPVRLIDRVDGRYRYRGLFRVEAAYPTRGRSGFTICR